MSSESDYCTDLSNDSKSMISNHLSGLCTVCHMLDFVTLTREACPECRPDERHFHLGTLYHITKKEFCPGCRLIVSVVRSLRPSHDKFDESTITLQQRFLLASEQKPHQSLHEHMTSNNDKTAIKIATLHGESLIDVVYNQYVPETSEYRPIGWLGLGVARTVGTIIRANVVEPTRSSALRRLKLFERFILPRRQSFHVRGRNVPQKVDINLIKHWMQSCNTQHDRCRLSTLPTKDEHSIRLVDVEDYKVVSATSTERYLALSYVWGLNTTPLLIRDNISQCSSLHGLKSLMIPRTISDAIQFVRDIGERYLWVDSLCIVQDDDDDKQQQLPFMANIYSYAELVIVAAAGCDADAGLPGIRDTRLQLSPHVEEIHGIRFMTAQPAVQQALEWSAWNSRGWTLQEAILARRALVFTESVVYWNCQVDTWREDMSCESLVARLHLDETNSLWATLLSSIKRRTFTYCHLAQIFSQRRLKEESDIVWAINGILRLQIPKFPQGFIWGLPYESLDATLLWSEDSSCANVHLRDASHTVVRKRSSHELAYPSWSWLSSNTRISFEDPCGESVISEVTWNQPIMSGDDKLATQLKPSHFDGRVGKSECKQSTNLLAKCDAELVVMDYGLLRFTAQTALLTLRRAGESDRQEAPEVTSFTKVPWINATIHSPQGEFIGKLRVPLSFFNKSTEQVGDFILLSRNDQAESEKFRYTSNLGDEKQFTVLHEGCRHDGSRNIMLIEWNGDIAYRQSLGKVDEECWKKVKTQVKEIILG